MSTIPSRPLGRNGPLVSAIGFGTMGLSIAYGSVPASRQTILSKSVELGSTLIDTATVYGDSEDLIGAWLASDRSLRDRIFLATKFGVTTGSNGAWYARGDAAYVRESIDRSFQRLGVDVIDLMYIHRIDGTVPIEETVGAIAEYVKAGKIRYIGLSEASAETIRRAHAVHPIAAVQVEYSPFALEIEDPNIGVLATARELGIAIVAYSPLGRGILSGRYKSIDDFEEGDYRRTSPRFSAENFPKNLVLVDRIVELAAKKGVTPAQLTLAWILAQGEDFFVIPGTKRAEILEENVGAANVQLSAEEVALIRKFAEESDVAGERYPGNTGLHLYADSAPKRE